MNQRKILLLNCDPTFALGKVLGQILESSHLQIQIRHEIIGADDPTSNRIDLSGTIRSFLPDLIILVLFSNSSGRANLLFESLRTESPNIPILAVIEMCEPDEVLQLLKLGLADFITPPLKAVDIVPRIWRILEHTRQDEILTKGLKEKLGLKQFIGESVEFISEVKKIPLVAKCDVSVLITGETGTGKELCARAIHYLSPRAHKLFTPVNCGAIPLELLENELFGHERGAFTGAITTELGLIREADGGTLFLDEIDCIPQLAQVKLLRFLQEKEFRPLGASTTHKADVRIIAAMNIDIEKAVGSGKLRRDLYYRLNVIPLVMPPLRERQADILLLAHHFLAKYAAEFNKPVPDFSADATQLLLLYDWPGNVRELEHIVERAVLLCEQRTIRSVDIGLPKEAMLTQQSFQEVKTRMIAKFERAYIQGLLHAHQGNITRAAQAAQKNRRAFWQLIRKYRIDAQNFKAAAS